MKKMNRKVISLILAMLMIISSTVAGMIALADDTTSESTTASEEHNCATDGHDYAAKFGGYADANGNKLTADQIDENYKYTDDEGNLVSARPYHYYECDYCGDIKKDSDGDEIDVFCKKAGGWQHDEEKLTHYIGCTECDLREHETYCADVNLNYIDSTGKTTTDGLCDVCGAELDHKYQKSGSTPATCTSTGYDTYTCINCADTFTVTTSSALGHHWPSSEASKFLTFEWDTDNFTYCKAVFNCEFGCGAKMEYTAYANSGNKDNIVEITEDTPATCTTAGKTVYTATFTIKDIKVNGWEMHTNDDGTYTFTATYIVEKTALGHNFSILTDAKQATCTDGEVSVYKCTRCDATNNEAGAEALGHDVDHWVSNDDATCTDDGTKTGTCTRCGESVTVPDEGSALGHSEAAPVQENVIEATCTQNGSYDSVVYCSRCNKELSRNNTVTIPALGHSGGEVKTENVKPATCTEAGSHDNVIYCTREGCGAELSRETVTDKALEHNYETTEVITKEAACPGGDGEKVVTTACTRCGDIKETKTEVIALDEDDPSHDYVKSGNRAATCTSAPADLYTCRKCGTVKTVATSDRALGHLWDTDDSSDYITYTYDENNFQSCTITFKCRRPDCSQTLSYTVYNDNDSVNSSELGKIVSTGYVEATCENGSGNQYTAEFYIDNNGDGVKETYTHNIVIPDGKTEATGHNYDTAVVTKEPTCLTAGTQTETCKTCGYVKTTEIPATGTHTYGEYTVTKEAKCTETGEETATCSVCGKITTRTVEALGHNYVQTTGTAPTCTEDGEGTQVCSRCGDTITSVIPATGHTVGSYTEQPTCTDAGIAVCSKCGAQFAVSALGHTDENVDGICDRCNENIANADIAQEIRISINTPSNKVIPYGHTLVLTAETSEALPLGYSVVWTVIEGEDKVDISVSDDGMTCEVKAKSAGTVTVKVELCDASGYTATFANGRTVSDTLTVKTTSTFFQKIVSFLKTILFISKKIY